MEQESIPPSDDPATLASARIGMTLAGKWRLERVVGVGGMAAVYEAQHRNQSRVAIKMLHAELSVDPSIRRRFLQEGYAGNSIHHPGVPRVLDDDVAEDGSAFLVMDLLEGRSLETILESRVTLQPALVLMIADQILDVLETAHARGVIHRDIKPDNVFLTTTGDAKLLDFGIAKVKAQTKATTMGTFMGTPAYCPPEQARGRWSDVDERTDIWAVGATMFAALSGRPVHLAETATEQLALAVHAEAPPLLMVAPDVPPAVAEIVDRALGYEKINRHQSATAFRQAIAEAAEHVEPSSILLQELATASLDTSTSKTLVAGSSKRRLRLDSQETGPRITHGDITRVAATAESTQKMGSVDENLARDSDPTTVGGETFGPVTKPGGARRSRTSITVVGAALGFLVIGGLAFGLAKDDTNETPHEAGRALDDPALAPAEASATADAASEVPSKVTEGAQQTPPPTANVEAGESETHDEGDHGNEGNEGNEADQVPDAQDDHKPAATKPVHSVATKATTSVPTKKSVTIAPREGAPASTTPSPTSTSDGDSRKGFLKKRY